MSEPIIGFVSFGGGMILAELLGVDRWRVTVAGRSAPGMARTLTALYADTYHGPQDGYYGQLILLDLASRTGGASVFNAPPPSAPNTVY